MYSLPDHSLFSCFIGKSAIFSSRYFCESPYPNSQLHHFDSIARSVATNINLSYFLILSFIISAVSRVTCKSVWLKHRFS